MRNNYVGRIIKNLPARDQSVFEKSTLTVISKDVNCHSDSTQNFHNSSQYSRGPLIFRQSRCNLKRVQRQKMQDKENEASRLEQTYFLDASSSVEC